MGFISGIQAINAIAKIKKGQTANLSIAQITNLIVNLPDAQKNLSPREYKMIYDLFNELKKCKTKIPQTMETYMKTCTKIIKKFNTIAPYIKYSGGNEIEFSFLMDDIGEAYDEPNTTITSRSDTEIVLDEEARKYMNYIIEQAPVKLKKDDANAIMKIIYHSSKNGKDDALKEFDILAKRVIEENQPIEAMMKISYMSGLLYPNGVLEKDESNKLSKKYVDQISNTF